MVEQTEESIRSSASELLTSVRGPPREVQWAAPGGRLGRYRVLEQIGRGGMGAVYLAQDSELDRKIAIKVLGRRRKGQQDAARLQREAQAMARLNHDNVVTVFEVGTHEEQVFLAMEYIDGTTLREWKKSKRAWSEVLELFISAGRALAAAHEVGLVHRDFKPDNVMIASSGRVVVLDFGLARGSGDTGSDPMEVSGASGPSSGQALLEVDLTETGAILGTPAYMSPEGFSGRRIDAQADQFSFCVALYEALYGSRPFAGSNFMQLRSNVRSGTMQRIEDRRGVPRWLHKAVLRGLSGAPEDRYPSMRALLQALGDAAPRRRGRWVIGALAVTGAAVAAAILLPGDAAVCEGGPERVAQSWNDDARERLRLSLGAETSDAANQAWTRASDRLDAYAQGWAAAYASACDEGRGSATLDRRMACLNERRLSLGALVTALIEGGSAMVVRAVPSVVALAPPIDCLDVAKLDRFALPDDPVQAKAVVGIRARIAEAVALARTGRYAPALDAVVLAAYEAEETRYSPLVVQAQLQLGVMRLRTGNYDAARGALERGFQLASELGLDDPAARAAVQLVHLHGDVRGEFEDAVKWAQHGRPLVERTGSRALVGQLENALATVYLRNGDYAEVRTHASKAKDEWIAALGEEHPYVANAHNNLGTAAYRLGELATAEREHTEALRIWTEAFGSAHPEVGTAHVNLGLTAFQRGDSEAARQHYAEALTSYEAAYGPVHLRVAAVLNNLGLVERREEDLEQAKAHFARARDVLTEVHSADHPHVGAALNNLADIARAQGELEAAKKMHRRALAIYEKTYGASNERVATPLLGIGAAATDGGQHAEAVSAYTRAIRILKQSVGESGIKFGQAVLGLGRSTIALGKRDEGLALLEQAVAVQLGADGPPEKLAEAQFELAKALPEAARERAAKLAQSAFDGFPEVNPARAEVEAWLAKD